MNRAGSDRNERLADSNAHGEWASTFAWGFAVLAAVVIWAVSAH